MTRRSWLLLAPLLLAVSCSRETPTKAPDDRPRAKGGGAAPSLYRVKFETTKGDFVVEVNRAWAPRGADRFHELVTSGYYDGSRFFRVLPKFVVQFGISKDPKANELWSQLQIPDDPVKESNKRGMVTFAMRGPGTRTAQVFINMADNSQSLDGRGFAPFGRVVEGMEVVGKLFAGYGEMAPRGGGPDPMRIQSMGEEYLERSYPRLDVIKSAKVVS